MQLKEAIITLKKQNKPSGQSKIFTFLKRKNALKSAVARYAITKKAGTLRMSFEWIFNESCDDVATERSGEQHLHTSVSAGRVGVPSLFSHGDTNSQTRCE